MPVVQVSVPAGVLSNDQKQQLISRITDVVVDVEGIPQLRGGVHVLINEVADGGWGTGGKAWTLQALRASFGERADATS
ncbi:MAG: tautomerase [Mycobacterium sp.]|uniref:tautomerase family protein n=1 Tax=Mycobacterium sp. TaxID=1785 RepID=UPI002614E548|nr:4-oxalocrotonate tautomerase family protein [Mycobacterium sp.]MCW2663079.1 tautomerase [Mycobacterium sp.]